MSVQTVEVAKSHYTNSTAPAVVQTQSGQLHSNSTQLRAFFGWTLPAKPVGETLTSAVIKVTDTSTGGSVDTITYSTCSDVWDEATLCWNNQPAVSNTIGTLVNPAAISTTYDITVSPLTEFIAAAGGNISVCSVGSALDTFTVWHRLNALAANRPQIVLTFTPDVVPPTLVQDFAGLRAAGYTGSLSDMRRQNLLALLVLTEPQAKSNNDLEFQYLRSIGKTGTLNDMRKQP